MKNALFIRLDKMGDLILTLPCDQLVSQKFQVHWAIPRGLDFVMDTCLPKRDFESFARPFSWLELKKFYYFVKKMKPEVSICYHVPWWIPFCLWLCRVKVRGGVLSQWHSYLFFNKGLRQKRSHCELHELDYNYQLTEFVFDLPLNNEKWLPVQLIEPSNVKINFDINQNYFVVHPGMGGSALNWPTKNYVDLINELTEKAVVVITGTQSDDLYLKPLKLALKENQKVVWLDKQLSGYQLLVLLKHANATIAPSTGVLHLSASLGVPSLGIYSPIKVHQDKRWGPKGIKAQAFSPQVNCPASYECLNEQCPQFNCMAKMSISPIVKTALATL
jgi:heptosyltransferase I